MTNKQKSGRPSWLQTVAILIIVAFLVTLVILVAPRQPQNLYPAQVRNYEGVNLSSIGDVVENAIKGTQYINATTYHLNITGIVASPLQLTYDEVVSDHQAYRKVVSLYCVEGWTTTILWEGVLIKDLLVEAGADMSSPVVIFRASDGYSTALPMDYIINKNILLAYKMNNLTIPNERGFPFQLVAESQYGYKWIKWITGIEVSKNADYLGYWESRGYPNNATFR